MTLALTRDDAPARLVSSFPCQEPEAADLFFSEHAPDLDLAKSLCAACPFQRECLDGALAREEPWGVWGGQIFVAGSVVAQKRSRGRPRKQSAA